MSADQTEDSVHRRTPRNCATQGELVFGRAVFLSSPLPAPPPLARFVPQPDPDLAARIQNGDLITNSGFFRAPKTACMQATRLAAIVVKNFHSQREIKEILDPEKHTFSINSEHKST